MNSRESEEDSERPVAIAAVVCKKDLKNVLSTRGLHRDIDKSRSVCRLTSGINDRLTETVLA